MVRPPLRERATSFVLAVGITLLIIIGMLTLNGRTPERPHFKGTVLLDLKPDEEAADTTQKQVSKPQRREQPRSPPKPPSSPPKPVLPTQPEDMRTYYIHLTKEENDAADISRLPHAIAGSQSGQQSASNSGDSRPVGTAPDGEPLYAAEWYRRPTHAELSFYLPKHMPPEGWGLIACKTVAAHHVDDCVELGSSPAGSHLAGAVRQAAWQFLVRAPRLGGKELVGAWVRIRIDYEENATDGTDDL